MLDATVVRAHTCAAGDKRGRPISPSAAHAAVPVIPPHPARVRSRATDGWLSKERARIEVTIGLIKHDRRGLARLDKLARCHLAFVHLAAACIQLR
jgi:hypothetical protein